MYTSIPQMLQAVATRSFARFQFSQQLRLFGYNRLSFSSHRGGLAAGYSWLGLPTDESTQKTAEQEKRIVVKSEKIERSSKGELFLVYMYMCNCQLDT